MAITDFLNAGTQMVSQFGGMALQNSYNKKAERRQDRYNRGALDYAISRQPQINQQNRQSNLKYWKDTSFPAQREMMEKAGLNAGLMYGGAGGAGGVSGNASGVANVNGVQTSAPDVQGAMGTAGMALMNAAQIGLIKAQTRNVEADTTNKLESTAGVTAESRSKTVDADTAEANYQNALAQLDAEKRKALGEADSAEAKGYVDQATVNEKVYQEQLRTIKMGLETNLTESQTALTEAQREETAQRINKIVTEIQNMKDLTAIQKENMLSQRMQVEFNTNTAAQVRQWTGVAKDVLETTGKGKRTEVNKTQTFNNNKNYDYSKNSYE